MANLKDLIVNGVARIVGKVYSSGGFVGNLEGTASNANKVNNLTVQTAVPANAVFTDTKYNFVGVTFNSGNSGSCEHDANNITANGNYYYTSNGPATTLGATTGNGALYSQAYNNSWVAQIAQDYRNGRLFVRGKNDGVWQNWLKVALSSDIPTNTNQLTNGAGFTTNTGTVTSVAVKMNGATKGTVTGSGTIDLGTVLTSHQTITSSMVTNALGYTPMRNVDDLEVGLGWNVASVSARTGSEVHINYLKPATKADSTNGTISFSTGGGLTFTRSGLCLFTIEMRRGLPTKDDVLSYQVTRYVTSTGISGELSVQLFHKTYKVCPDELSVYTFIVPVATGNTYLLRCTAQNGVTGTVTFNNSDQFRCFFRFLT